MRHIVKLIKLFKVSCVFPEYKTAIGFEWTHSLRRQMYNSLTCDGES